MSLHKSIKWNYIESNYNIYRYKNIYNSKKKYTKYFSLNQQCREVMIKYKFYSNFQLYEGNKWKNCAGDTNNSVFNTDKKLNNIDLFKKITEVN